MSKKQERRIMAIEEADRPPSITSKLELVGPCLAGEWLATCVHNRRVRSSNVKGLVRDILAGQWETHHQGIAFDGPGHLVDGRHRLLAIIRSNTSVWIHVFRGVPSESQRTMDVGAGRDLADRLTLVGDWGEVRPIEAAMLRRFISGERNYTFMTSSEELDAWTQHGELIRDVWSWFPRKHRRLSSVAVVGSVARAAHAAMSTSLLREFCELLVSDDLRSATISSLRSFLVADKRLDSNIAFRATTKAIQEFVDQKGSGESRVEGA